MVPATLLALTGTASAQGWLAERRYTEGPGIRTGDLELHPGIGGEVGYDSNWYLRSHEEGPGVLNGPPANPPADAAVFRLTPSFYVSTLGMQRLQENGTERVEPRMVSFRGGVSATGRAFIGKEMSRQHNIGVNADARLDIAQGRPLGFGVFAGYNRIIQPSVLADPNLSFNRSDIRAGAEVIAIPGGGTLDMRLGYQLLAALFEESNGVPFSSLTHEVSFKDRWRFRPRTALFSDTTLRFIDYPNADRAIFYLNSSTPLRTRFGITGLLTDRFGALLAAGYGATFFADPNAVTTKQFDSFMGQAEGTFYLGQGAQGVDDPGKATLLLSTISLGVQRDFQASLLGGFYNSNKAYGRVEYWFGHKVLIRYDLYGEQLNYPDSFSNIPGGAGAALQPGNIATGAANQPLLTEFTNYRVGTGLFAEYRLTSAFGINTTIDYVQQFSGTQIPNGTVPVTPGGPAIPTFFDMNYRRFQAFLGVRYFF